MKVVYYICEQQIDTSVIQVSQAIYMWQQQQQQPLGSPALAV